NSFRAVERALRFEKDRQFDVLRRGGRVEQETRGWVEDRGVTVSQRTKEQAHDYRYFPEPDLPPLAISQEMVTAVASRLPELPAQRQARPVGEDGERRWCGPSRLGSRSCRRSGRHGLRSSMGSVRVRRRS